MNYNDCIVSRVVVDRHLAAGLIDKTVKLSAERLKSVYQKANALTMRHCLPFLSKKHYRTIQQDIY